MLMILKASRPHLYSSVPLHSTGAGFPARLHLLVPRHLGTRCGKGGVSKAFGLDPKVGPKLGLPI